MSPQVLLELRAGFDQRMQDLGQQFRLDRTGDHWDGILLRVPPADPTMELGSDWRELATLEARRDGMPALKYGDIITQVRPFWSFSPDDEIPKWKVIRREDNPADFAIKYWLVFLPTADDGSGFIDEQP